MTSPPAAAPVIWMTGLSGAGKSTLANALADALRREGNPCVVVDGDRARKGLNRGLGFSVDDRMENIRRIAEVAAMVSESSVTVVVSVISPHRSMREMARGIIGDERFLEVWVSCSLEECERRDVKGLYKQARDGRVAQFTGVSAEYENPDHPWLVVETSTQDLSQCVHAIHSALQARLSSQAR